MPQHARRDTGFEVERCFEKDKKSNLEVQVYHVTIAREIKYIHTYEVGSDYSYSQTHRNSLQVLITITGRRVILRLTGVQLLRYQASRPGHRQIVGSTAQLIFTTRQRTLQFGSVELTIKCDENA